MDVNASDNFDANKSQNKTAYITFVNDSRFVSHFKFDKKNILLLSDFNVLFCATTI